MMGKLKKDKSQIFRYPSLHDKQVAYGHIDLGSMHEQIGILTLEITQPSLNAIEHTGMICVKRLRAAQPVDQLSKTTDAIQYLLKKEEAEKTADTINKRHP